MNEHPLAVNKEALAKQLDINKYLGQVLLGIAVSLSVRYLIKKYDQFTGKGV